MPRERSEEVKALMAQGLSHEAAKKRLARMSPNERDLLKGERIRGQGGVEGQDKVPVSFDVPANVPEPMVEGQTEQPCLIRLKDALNDAEASYSRPLEWQEKEEIAASVKDWNDTALVSVMKSEGVSHYTAREVLGDAITGGEEAREAKREEKFGVLRQEKGETFTLASGEVIPIFRRGKDEK